MRNFDRWIRQCTGVYYYARFVDDIIILCSSKDSADAIIKTLPSQLGDICCLKINTKKHYLLDEQALINGDKLEYLGYQFRYEMRNNKRVLSISIADKKIKKIKNRIIRSLTQFVKTGDFALLENRLKFLTGNYSIKKERKPMISKLEYITIIRLFNILAVWKNSMPFSIKHCIVQINHLAVE